MANSFVPTAQLPQIDLSGFADRMFKEAQQRGLLQARQDAVHQIMTAQNPQDKVKALMGYAEVDPRGAAGLGDLLTSTVPQTKFEKLRAFPGGPESIVGITQDPFGGDPTFKQYGGGGGQQAQGGPAPTTEGELSADKKYGGGDYLTWKQGGFSEVQQALKSLQYVKKQLDTTPDPEIGSSIVGLQVKKSLSGKDDAVSTAMRMAYPQEFNFAAGHQRGVIATLRPILGARAAQQLFQSVLQSTYDPMAGHKENSRRLGLVIENISKAAKAKQDMSDYFGKTGTLHGAPVFDPDKFDFTAGIGDSNGGSAPKSLGKSSEPEGTTRRNKAGKTIVTKDGEWIEQ